MYGKLNLKINYPPPYEREIWSIGNKILHTNPIFKMEQSFQVSQMIHDILLSPTEVSKQQHYSRIFKKKN